nr:PREDICTED: uncharacterized protein LOC105676916 [Linepithema humile]
MFFMLKLVLIFLLHETQAYIMQDIERILLPALNTTEIEEIPLTLKVFGKQIKLNLRRNDKNVSSTYKVWKHDAKDITKEFTCIGSLLLFSQRSYQYCGHKRLSGIWMGRICFFQKRHIRN